MRKCQRMLLNQQDTEDIVQGLFLDMLKAGKSDWDLPYLYRAVTNRCINHLKYGDNRRRLLEQHQPALRGPVRTPCDELIIGSDLLVKLVETLDDKSIEVLIYRFFDDMTQDEIATLLKTSRKTVGKRVAKIKAAVKELVKRNGDHAGAAKGAQR